MNLGRLKFAIVVLWALLCFGSAVQAQEEVFDVEPAQSHVFFTLDDVLHTVHGTFQLKSGTIHFDPATGVADGQLVVDATSGNSGSNARDRKMHKDVLESAKYPEFVFAVEHVSGAIPASGATRLEVQGNMIMHGASHPMTLSVPVTITGDHAAADIDFDVPYVKWGLKNPSTLFLRVSQDVKISVHAVGHLQRHSTP